MTFVLLGLNILLLLAAWRFMVKRTVLDHTRDKLFDLRDEVRDVFLSKGWELNSPQYKKLRGLLNGHLRFTEDYSIWKVAYLNMVVEKNQHARSEMNARFEKVFTSNIPEQLEYIHSVRQRSLMAVMDFTVIGSGFLLFLSLIIFPIVLAVQIVEVMSRGVDVAIDVGFRSISNLGRSISSLFSSVANLLTRQIFRSNWLESYSYKMGCA